jgi:hypothetical protein
MNAIDDFFKITERGSTVGVPIQLATNHATVSSQKLACETPHTSATVNYDL